MAEEGREKILRSVYERIAHLAKEASDVDGEPWLDDAAYNPAHRTGHNYSYFWVRLSKNGLASFDRFNERAKIFLEKLKEEGLIGGLVVNTAIEEHKIGSHIGGYTITGNDKQVFEGKDDLLKHLGAEIIKSFRLAEETHYEDMGRVPDYTIKLAAFTGAVSMQMFCRTSAGGTSYLTTSQFRAIQNRFSHFIREYLADHLLRPRVTMDLGGQQANFYLDFENLKEELSPNDFAEKIAYHMVDLIKTKLIEKGARNVAAFNVERTNGGVPMIRAMLANRQELTRAAVQRAMKDVADEELPPDNLLKLTFRFGSMGTAATNKHVLMSIRPVH